MKNDKTYLEREPLQNISKKNLLGAFKHRGYWQCMDTKRDKEILVFEADMTIDVSWENISNRTNCKKINK